MTLVEKIKKWFKPDPGIPSYILTCSAYNQTDAQRDILALLIIDYFASDVCTQDVLDKLASYVDRDLLWVLRSRGFILLKTGKATRYDAFVAWLKTIDNLIYPEVPNESN